MLRQLSRMIPALWLAALVPAASEPLPIERRIALQREIERVYWSARTWPAENPGPKPAFESMVPPAAAREKVEAALRASDALARRWERPITAEQLQRELDRIVRHTKDARLLSRLLEALDGDPFLAAEMIARPVLADRLARTAYAWDPELHAAVRRRAAATLAQARRGDDLHALGAEVTDVAGQGDAGEEWSPLEETELGFVSRRGTRELLWPKTPFEQWQRQADLSTELVPPSVTYKLDALASSSCSPDGWQQLGGLPDARAGHSAVWTGSEMLLFGGYKEGTDLGSNAALLRDLMRYDPATDTWTPGRRDTAPSRRTGHSAVWTGTHLIVWGGRNINTSAYLADGGSYDPQTDTWTALGATGAPASRAEHTAVWTGTQMIVWGGITSGSSNQSGGRYDPVTDAWAPINVAGAPSGSGAAAWTGSRMIVWGGLDGAGNRTSTGGRYDPVADQWTPMSTVNAPSARASHAAVWTGSRVLVWGGSIANSVYTTTGGLYDPSTDSWVATSTTGAPGPFQRNVAVWGGSRLIVWGLTTSTSWRGGRYDPAANTWADVSTVAAPTVSGRAVWTGSEMVLFGNDGLGLQGQGGRYNPAMDTWVRMSDGGRPPANAVAHVTWIGGEILAYAGSGPLSGWRWDPALDTWSTLPSAGAPPGRLGSAAVWTGSHLVVWGGGTVGSYPTAGGRYDPGTNAWLAMSTSGVPAGRSNLSAVWSGAEMIVFGGSTTTTSGLVLPTGSGGRYDPSSDQWRPMVSTNRRTGHPAVWTGDRMVVWGGADYSGTIPFCLSSGGRYDPLTDTWTATSLVGAPPVLCQAQMVWTGSRALVWMGRGAYDPVADVWSPMSSVDAPHSGARGAWSGTHLIVWSGSGDSEAGGLYHPQTDSWSGISTALAPNPRTRPLTTWLGTRLFVLGGDLNFRVYTDTGGVYCVDCTQTFTHHRDRDQDGFGAPAETLESCDATPPAGWASLGGDCDDADPTRHPGATEVCNGVDDDCDDLVDVDVLLGSPDLTLGKSGEAVVLSWTAAGGTLFDVVKGSVLGLVSNGGDFTSATSACLADDATVASAPDLAVPPAGEGFWYLVRAQCTATGSYDSGAPSQQGSRDAEIAGSAAACP